MSCSILKLQKVFIFNSQSQVSSKTTNPHLCSAASSHDFHILIIHSLQPVGISLNRWSSNYALSFSWWWKVYPWNRNWVKKLFQELLKAALHIRQGRAQRVIGGKIHPDSTCRKLTLHLGTLDPGKVSVGLWISKLMIHANISIYIYTHLIYIHIYICTCTIPT